MIFLLFLQLAYAQTIDHIDAGKYLVHAAGCRDCHTADGGAPFAGGLKVPTPFGTFVTPNITGDWRTGIGRWTRDDFHRALRSGVSPHGKVYYPTFPYASFTFMSDEDLDDIYSYLQSVPSVNRTRAPNRIEFPFDQRWLVNVWRILYFEKGPLQEDPNQSPQWNRGAYLVKAVLHCGECHTPRTSLGGPIDDQFLAGSNLVFSGKSPPNITPDILTGLDWSEEDWERFLSSGFTPSGKEMSAEMALVIRETAGLTEADRQAVVAYLKSIPAVKRFNANE